MPSGGRLIVKLARVTVDGNFVTKYPNVRQGPHALITVTEVRATPREEWQIEGAAGERELRTPWRRPRNAPGAYPRLRRSPVDESGAGRRHGSEDSPSPAPD